jgi:hypothetical protein
LSFGFASLATGRESFLYFDVFSAAGWQDPQLELQAVDNPTHLRRAPGFQDGGWPPTYAPVHSIPSELPRRGGRQGEHRQCQFVCYLQRATTVSGTALSEWITNCQCSLLVAETCPNVSVPRLRSGRLFERSANFGSYDGYINNASAVAHSRSNPEPQRVSGKGVNSGYKTDAWGTMGGSCVNCRYEPDLALLGPRSQRQYITRDHQM